jgi:chromosome segregation ATPase
MTIIKKKKPKSNHSLQQTTTSSVPRNSDISPFTTKHHREKNHFGINESGEPTCLTIPEQNKEISELILKLRDVISEKSELVEKIKNKDIYITYQNEVIDWKTRENEKQRQTIANQAATARAQQVELAQKDPRLGKVSTELETKQRRSTGETQTIDILRQRIEKLNQEVASRSKIIDDMVHQWSEQQGVLTERTLQVETLQNDRQRWDDVTDTLHLEIETRNKIIETIQDQLTQSQSQLIENSYLTDQLSDELEWNRNLLAETRDDLAEKEEELLSKTHETVFHRDEIQKVQDELELLREEFVTRGKLIEEMEQQFADQQMMDTVKTEEIATLQATLARRNRELEEKEQDLAKAQQDADDLNRQIASRNTIIGELQNQVMTDQTSLVEKTHATQQLHAEFEEKQRHFEQKDHEIVHLQTELANRMKRVEELTTTLNRREDEFLRLQDELEKTQEAREALTTDLLEGKEMIADSEREIDQLKTDFEKKWVDLILKNIEVRDFKEQTLLLQTKLEQQEQLITHTQGDLEKKENELRNRTKAMEEQQAMIETLKTEIATRSGLLASIEEELTRQQTRLIQQTQLEVHLHDELEQRNTQLERQQQELQQKETDLKRKTQESNEQQKKMTQLKAELEQRKRELDDYSSTMVKLEHEKDRYTSLLEQMKNSIPTPLLFIDKESKITIWNQQATHLFGLKSDNEPTLDRFLLGSMELERIRNGLRQCFQEKKPVMLKSISLKNQDGTRSITDISLVPLFEGNEETQGAFLIVYDISDVTDLQKRLERQKEEILALETRCQDTYTQLKAPTIENTVGSKDATMIRTELDVKTTGHVEALLEEKKRELEATNELIASKVHELNDVTKKLDGIRLELDVFEAEKKKMDMQKTPPVPSEEWKEKLKIYNEIDKWLNGREEGLQTKKIKESEEK